VGDDYLSGGVERKDFFFEKKKQKAFVRLGFGVS
jgi:hypothetical protein